MRTIILLYLLLSFRGCNLAACERKQFAQLYEFDLEALELVLVKNFRNLNSCERFKLNLNREHINRQYYCIEVSL